MITRLSGFISRLPSPRSLRKQLLAISLIILSVLLLLIGVLQYVLMRNFIYTNRAESMETQLRSVPREFYFTFLNSGNSTPADLSISGASDPSWTTDPPEMVKPELPGASPATNGAPGVNQNTSPDGQRMGGDRRPLLLDAHTTIAIYSPDGTFKDFQEDTLSDSAAPRMTNKEYDELLKHTTDKQTGEYG